MIITLHTEGWYDAAHHLENYEGKCANQHGHTYKVEVWVKGKAEQLKSNGILWDFGNLKKVIKEFDHKNLNKLFNDDLKINSTAENQSLYIYNVFKRDRPDLSFKVRVYEQLNPKQSYSEVGDFE